MAKTLPLPCVYTAFLAKTMPLPYGPQVLPPSGSSRARKSAAAKAAAAAVSSVVSAQQLVIPLPSAAFLHSADCVSLCADKLRIPGIGTVEELNCVYKGILPSAPTFADERHCDHSTVGSGWRMQR